MYQKAFKVDESGIVGISILVIGTATNHWQLARVTCGSFRWFANQTIDRQIQLLKGSYSASHPSQLSIAIWQIPTR